MRSTLRRGLALLTLAALTLPIAACSTRPAANVEVLYYKAGAGDNREFVQCIQPGTSGPYPIDDETFSIRTDTRTWNIAPDGGDSKDAIESGSAYGANKQPGPKVKVWLAADFVINRDCSAGKDSPVVKFWETLGRRYGISVNSEDDGWKDDGWKNLLQNTLVVAERKALVEGTRFYLADDLDSNAHGERAELEKRIAPLFQQELRAKLGGDFFCGVTFTTDAKGKAQEVEYDEYVQEGTNPDGTLRFRSERRKSTCPPVRISITDVDFADPNIAAARAEVYAAEQRAKAKLAEAQGELDKANKLGEAAKNPYYLAYKQIEAQLAAAEACRSNPACTVIIDGTGKTGVNVGK